MLSRREFTKTVAVAFIGAAVLPVLGTGVGTAQDAPIMLAGRVEWIAAQVMVISLDGRVIAAGAPAAINVDLSQIDQDEYQGLVAGDPVLVIGTVSAARNRVIATSILRPA
jgi:hypothetical protein